MNKSKRHILKTIIKIIISTILCVVIFKKLGINVSNIIKSVQNIPLLLLSVITPLLCTTALSANRWKSFLNMIATRESFLYLYKTILISVFCGVALPSAQGADIFRIYYIEKRHPEARGKVGSTVFVERILGLICLAFIAAIAWLFVNVNVSFWPIVILVAIVVFVVWVIMSNWWYLHIQQWLQSMRILPRVMNYFSKLYEGLHTFPFNKSLVWSIVLIFMLQLSNILVVYFLFEACGCHIDFIYHLCYQPLISVITMIPITFGGIGLREGGFAYFYTQLGISGDVIIAVSLMYYVVITLIPAMFGGILYLTDTIKGIKSK